MGAEGSKAQQPAVRRTSTRKAGGRKKIEISGPVANSFVHTSHIGSENIEDVNFDSKGNAGAAGGNPALKTIDLGEAQARKQSGQLLGACRPARPAPPPPQQVTACPSNRGAKPTMRRPSADGATPSSVGIAPPPIPAAATTTAAAAAQPARRPSRPAPGKPSRRPSSGKGKGKGKAAARPAPSKPPRRSAGSAGAAQPPPAATKAKKAAGPPRESVYGFGGDVEDADEDLAGFGGFTEEDEAKVPPSTKHNSTEADPEGYISIVDDGISDDDEHPPATISASSAEAAAKLHIDEATAKANAEKEAAAKAKAEDEAAAMAKAEMEAAAKAKPEKEAAAKAKAEKEAAAMAKAEKEAAAKAKAEGGAAAKAKAEDERKKGVVGRQIKEDAVQEATAGPADATAALADGDFEDPSPGPFGLKLKRTRSSSVVLTGPPATPEKSVDDSPFGSQLRRASDSRVAASPVKSSSLPPTPAKSGGIADLVFAKSVARVLHNTKMQTVDEILAGDPDDAEYEDIDERAIEAARWTDKEIRRLIDEIKTHGAQDGEGVYAVNFGRLFDATAQIFDAVSGILKTAKKYKIVTFEGEQLWQGKDDNTPITLLTDVHTGIKIKRRKKADLERVKIKQKGKGFGHKFEQGSKCAVCGKSVYQAEYVGASGKTFHKACFRCASCQRTLNQSDYSVSRDGKERCNNCHQKFEMSTF